MSEPPSTLPAGWVVPGVSDRKRRRWPIHGMEPGEIRQVGTLDVAELRKLKKSLETYHARNPGQRVAVKYEADGSVNVWRLR